MRPSPPRLGVLRVLVPGALLCGALAWSLSALAERSVVVVQSAPARIRIAAGAFTMGLGDAERDAALATCALGFPADTECDPALLEDERPARRVHVPAYLIDRTEVSQRAYRRCVAAGACAPSAASDGDPRIGLPDQPVVQVTWHEAASYCRFASGALPSEAQWERAARGNSLRTFPWGHVFNSRLANFGAADGGESEHDGYRHTAPVTAYPDGRSFYGALNMAGNVWELTADRYERPDGASPARPAASALERVMRGGSFLSPPFFLRTTLRAHLGEDERRPDVGFRCVYPPPAPVHEQPATGAEGTDN